MEIKKGQVWKAKTNGYQVKVESTTDEGVFLVGGYFANYDEFKKLYEMEGVKVINPTEGQKHYDNSNGSLYQFCEEKGLNSYEFDIIKRVMRCRKKGNFIEDLEKTKFLIDLYIKEHNEK